MEQHSKSESKVEITRGKEYWLRPENIKLIEEWAEKGLIVEQVAKNMGVHPATFYKWRNEHSEINDAWMKGKTAADMQVVNAMFKSATGYTTEEIVQERNEFGEMVESKRTLKEVAPNTTAQSMWLKNRMPDLFKDNQLTEHYREKVKAETDRIKAQTQLIELQKKVLQGDVKDTGHLAAIAALFKSGD